MEDSGLQIIRLWGPTIRNFENISFEILDLPSTKGSKTRVHGGEGCICIYIYIHMAFYFIVVWLYVVSASSDTVFHLEVG